MPTPERTSSSTTGKGVQGMSLTKSMGRSKTSGGTSPAAQLRGGEKPTFPAAPAKPKSWPPAGSIRHKN